ncbi:MAG TPA: cytochrome P450 [Thermoanaerobaculia bacterium]|jgi:cytochrome P450|nr:cytochrome P450 [Thermoanaerobaculia bacterium]
MDRAPEEVEFVTEMRARSLAEGGVFWTPEGELAVFDPEIAQKVNAINFGDLTLPDKLADVVRGRKGPPVSWKQVRSALITQLRRLSDAEGVGQLAERMSGLIEERLGRLLDMTWATQQVCTRALLPTVVDGLPPADRAHILRDQDFKLARLVRTQSDGESIWKEIRSIWIQIRAGNAVRRELRDRARGHRPRRLDLTDPIVDLLPELGVDRAVDAVTTVLTAIAGPPGAAAASLLYELTRRSDWAARLTAELAPLPLERLYGSPTQSAPETHRFVKEVLRIWSPPVFMTRPVRTGIRLDNVNLEPGQRYLLSTYLIHHDPRHWKDPDVFDPDRWLLDEEHGPCPRASYVPFGWAPKACIGASLGTTQLILLCHLMLTRYRLEVEEPESVRMMLAAVPMPVGFRGRIVRR